MRRIIIILLYCSLGYSQTSNARLDSTFTPYSLPQLQNFLNYYDQELDELQNEKKELIRRGIQDGELQLASSPDPKVIDQILIRLADLYYYQAKDQYMDRMEQYDQLLEAYDEGAVQDLPEEPKLDFHKSLAIYQRIIDEFPHSEFTDDAVYNRGFLQEEMGLVDQAVRIYLYFVEAFPSSKYIPDAYMRLGEYYFNPPLNDLNQAIRCYKVVMQYRSHNRYDEALYKLGWSYYRLSEYPEAISYFTTLVENLTEQQLYLAPRDARNDLLEEAIEYIAISFMDYGGPEKMVQYLDGLDWPEWSRDVLLRMGNGYRQQKEEYRPAIQTYKYLIDHVEESEALNVRKFIVDCYGALDDQENLFLARQDIYEHYNPKTPWWVSLDDERIKLDAYRISELAMRNNFNAMLKQVKENPNPEGFESTVDLGYLYLDTFPEDQYAYMIRWNVALILDTKLHRFKEALQEYLTISLVYSTEAYESFAREKGLSSIRDAAQNAIVITDTLIAQEKRLNSGQIVEVSDTLRAPIPLSDAQKWQAMAYDNYIKLFPFDEKTPAILSNAGALYYINNHFDEAIKYFKTLMKYFPGHEAARKVELSILESYFAKNDYESTEALAKKILSGNYRPEIKNQARQRLAEAIFLKAQGMASLGKDQKAADEYYRLALEVPQIEFADRALFNSANEYEKIQDYESAIRAYEMLRSTYSTSTLTTDALNNVALNYGEIGKNRLAGDRYRELAGLAKEPQKIQDALYNAYIFYTKGLHWTQAIETGIQFVNQFPEAEQAETMYYQIADHYIQLNQPRRGMNHLISFMWKFPKSARCIDASFELGKYYQSIDSLDMAERYYNQTFTTWQRMDSTLSGDYAFLAAEGLFNSTRMAHRKYEAVQFNVPAYRLKSQADMKEKLLRDLQEKYTEIVAMKTVRLPESLYRIAELYDQFALSWARQPINEKDPTALAVKEKAINERTAQIFQQALEAYLRASKGLRQLSLELAGNPLQKDEHSDSLAILTKTWREKSEIKASATLFRMARIHQESIDRLLATPVPQGLSPIEQLEYRSQVLVQAIQPLVNQVIAAHRRNIHVADSLGISNTWTQASNKQILEHLSLIAEQYQALSFEALREYSKMAALYRYRTLEKKQNLTQEFIDTMINMTELAKTYASAAVKYRKQGMQEAERTGLDMLAVAANREAMDQFALNLADTVAIDIGKARHDEQRANAFFESTQDLFYENTLAVFEDNEYYLGNLRVPVLESAFEAEPGYQYQRTTRNTLAAALLRIDPDTYSRKFGIQLAIKYMVTDTSWTCSYQPVQLSSNKPTESTVEVKPNGQRLRDPDWTNVPVYQIWIAPTNKISMLAFRKDTEITGLPIQAEMKMRSESPCRIYVNGEIAVDRAQNGSYDLSNYLKTGINQIGFVYSNQPAYSVRGWLTVRYVPKLL